MHRHGVAHRFSQAPGSEGLVSGPSKLPSALHANLKPLLNLVERWFRELTDQALRRGVLHSMRDLIASIEKDMDMHNENPRPFVSTASAES